MYPDLREAQLFQGPGAAQQWVWLPSVMAAVQLSASAARQQHRVFLSAGSHGPRKLGAARLGLRRRWGGGNSTEQQHQPDQQQQQPQQPPVFVSLPFSLRQPVQGTLALLPPPCVCLTVIGSPADIFRELLALCLFPLTYVTQWPRVAPPSLLAWPFYRLTHKPNNLHTKRMLVK